jgi:hypothetical protein
MGGTDDLAALTVKQLRERCAALGVDRERIEAARDADDPKKELIAFIRALIPSAPAPSVARIRNPSCGIDIELGEEPPLVVDAKAAPPVHGKESKLLMCMGAVAMLCSVAALVLVITFAADMRDGQLTIDANAAAIAANGVAIDTNAAAMTAAKSELLSNDVELLSAIDDEAIRAQAAESELQSAINDEAIRAQAAESELQSAIDDEATRAQTAESELQSAINDEATRAQAAESELQSAVGDLRAAGQAEVTMAGTSRSVGVRIREGGARGVLEMNIDGGGWDAVCDDGFGAAEADAVCRQLGFAGGGTSYDTTHGDSTFAMDDLDCPSGAADLSECSTSREPYSHNCGDSETVGIECDDGSGGGSTYLQTDHDGSSNPCRSDRTDYCCDFSCTYCGPREYCTALSPFQAHSGVCNPDYSGAVCENYFVDTQAPPPPPPPPAGSCSGSSSFASCISGTYEHQCCQGSCANSYGACYFCTEPGLGGSHCFDQGTVSTCEATHCPSSSGRRVQQQQQEEEEGSEIDSDGEEDTRTRDSSDGLDDGTTTAAASSSSEEVTTEDNISILQQEPDPDRGGSSDINTGGR